MGRDWRGNGLGWRALGLLKGCFLGTAIDFGEGRDWAREPWISYRVVFPGAFSWGLHRFWVGEGIGLESHGFLLMVFFWDLHRFLVREGIELESPGSLIEFFPGASIVFW